MGACVLVGMFFSVANLSLRDLSWVKLEEAFEQRGQSDRAEVLHARADRLSYACAVWRLLANLGALVGLMHFFVDRGALAGDSLMLLLAFVLTALLLLVFSVTIPRAWARYGGTAFLVACYPVLHVVEIVSRPLMVLHLMVEPVVRRLAGVSGLKANGTLEERQEELLSVVEEGEKEGVVDEEEREMIESVLEFRERTAGEIMTPRTDVIGIEVNATLADAASTITEAGHSRYPVYEEAIDQVIGMLYAKDLLRDLNQTSIGEGIRHRLRKAYFVPESKALRDLLHDFQNQKVHAAVVLDEYGGTAGLVTIEDVLEELVGEIEDEYETAKQEASIVEVDEQTLEVDARVHVEELNDDYELEIPEDEDYETMGGFAFSRLGSIPEKGASFRYQHLHFTVIDVGERQIKRLRVVIGPKEVNGNGRKKNDETSPARCVANESRSEGDEQDRQSV